MSFVDREIACLDCGQPFLFTAGEQEFYDRKGFKEEPKRCKPCRDARKARRNARPPLGVAQGSAAPIASQGDAVDDDIGNRAANVGRSAPARAVDAGGRPPRRGGDRFDRELHDAVCAQCGAQTRVPFRPVAGRPVYCRDCFGARRAGGTP